MKTHERSKRSRLISPSNRSSRTSPSHRLILVIRSTLKRACRGYNISWWSTSKRNKENNSLSNKFVQVAARDQIRQSSQSSISDPSHRKYLATAAPTEPHFIAAQATSIVTMKVKYGDDYIKFQLPVLRVSTSGKEAELKDWN